MSAREKGTDRFVVDVEQKHSMAALTQILRDTHTGVRYLFHRDGNAAGLTLLVDQHGRPA